MESSLVVTFLVIASLVMVLQALLYLMYRNLQRDTFYLVLVIITLGLLVSAFK